MAARRWRRRLTVELAERACAHGRLVGVFEDDTLAISRIELMRLIYFQR
jgi:hypothetical protein